MKAAAGKDGIGEFDALTKEEILENVKRRIAEIRRADSFEWEFCPELNPDVIVIPTDQTVIFEAQNERASSLLRRKCGWNTETITRRERIRVHPAQSHRLIAALSAAGLKVAY